MHWYTKVVLEIQQFFTLFLSISSLCKLIKMCFIYRYSTDWFKTHWNCNLNGVLKQSGEWCFWGFVSVCVGVCTCACVCVCPCMLIWGHVYTCLLKATIHNYKSISKCSLQNSISSLLQNVTLEFCPFLFVYICLPCYLLIFWQIFFKNCFLITCPFHESKLIKARFMYIIHACN